MAKYKHKETQYGNKIYNSIQALIKIGGTIITSFDGTDRQSVVVSNLYDDTQKGLMYYTFWNFATHKVLTFQHLRKHQWIPTYIHIINGD